MYQMPTWKVGCDKKHWAIANPSFHQQKGGEDSASG
jgi:hypothetical protein